MKREIINHGDKIPELIEEFKRLNRYKELTLLTTEFICIQKG